MLPLPLPKPSPRCCSQTPAARRCCPPPPPRRQVPKRYKSGMINSWNKFCYTGGYVEAAVQLPGNAQTSGFWVR